MRSVYVRGLPRRAAGKAGDDGRVAEKNTPPEKRNRKTVENIRRPRDFYLAPFVTDVSPGCRSNRGG